MRLLSGRTLLLCLCLYVLNTNWISWILIPWIWVVTFRRRRRSYSIDLLRVSLYLSVYVTVLCYSRHTVTSAYNCLFPVAICGRQLALRCIRSLLVVICGVKVSWRLTHTLPLFASASLSWSVSDPRSLQYTGTLPLAPQLEKSVIHGNDLYTNASNCRSWNKLHVG